MKVKISGYKSGQSRPTAILTLDSSDWKIPDGNIWSPVFADLVGRRISYVLFDTKRKAKSDFIIVRRLN